MIFFLIPIIIVVIGIIVFAINKIEQKEKKLGLCFVIINIVIIAFFRFIWPGASKYSEIIIPFWMNIIINIILLIVLFNKKITIGIKSILSIIIIYFLLMIFIPTYRLEEHEHTFINGYEHIQEYVDYYDCYGIKLKRSYK